MGILSVLPLPPPLSAATRLAGFISGDDAREERAAAVRALARTALLDAAQFSAQVADNLRNVNFQAQFKLHGLQELARRLKDLEVRVQRGVVRRSLYAGAVVIRDEARNMVPVNTGVLRRNIAVIAGKTPRNGSGRYTYHVGIRKITKARLAKVKQARSSGVRLSKKQINDPYYWTYVEFGTSRSRASPFLRPAFERAQYRAAQVIMETLRAELQQASGGG